MTNLKVLLNNVFPAGICDEICDYNLHCKKCQDLNEKECRYITYNQDYFEDTEMKTVAEKQIHFFKTRMEASPIYLTDTNKTDVRQMKREIDMLLNSPKIKEQFKRDKMHLQAIKSYVKHCWKPIYHILKNLHNMNSLNYLKQKWWFPNLDGNYTFRNKDYKIKNILDFFLNEYVKELFKYYEHYINEEEIKEHLQKFINLGN